jgi:hypothetical protein
MGHGSRGAPHIEALAEEALSSKMVESKRQCDFSYHVNPGCLDAISSIRYNGLVGHPIETPSGEHVGNSMPPYIQYASPRHCLLLSELKAKIAISGSEKELHFERRLPQYGPAIARNCEQEGSESDRRAASSHILPLQRPVAARPKRVHVGHGWDQPLAFAFGRIDVNYPALEEVTS